MLQSRFGVGSRWGMMQHSVLVVTHSSHARVKSAVCLLSWPCVWPTPPCGQCLQSPHSTFKTITCNNKAYVWISIKVFTHLGVSGVRHLIRCRTTSAEVSQVIVSYKITPVIDAGDKSPCVWVKHVLCYDAAWWGKPWLTGSMALAALAVVFGSCHREAQHSQWWLY